MIKIACVALTIGLAAPAQAANCLLIDYDNAPVAVISGRITTQHKPPKGSELRAADGPFLVLDTPLLTGDESECFRLTKIVILSDDPRLSGWAGKHVTIYGKLSRFISALVSPSIYIEAKTIKKD